MAAAWWQLWLFFLLLFLSGWYMWKDWVVGGDYGYAALRRDLQWG